MDCITQDGYHIHPSADFQLAVTKWFELQTDLKEIGLQIKSNTIQHKAQQKRLRAEQAQCETQLLDLFEQQAISSCSAPGLSPKILCYSKEVPQKALTAPQWRVAITAFLAHHKIDASVEDVTAFAPAVSQPAGSIKLK